MTLETLKLNPDSPNNSKKSPERSQTDFKKTLEKTLKWFQNNPKINKKNADTSK